jgi:hypothetical protein
VAACVLWVRSYLVADLLDWHVVRQGGEVQGREVSDRRSYQLMSGRGSIAATVTTHLDAINELDPSDRAPGGTSFSRRRITPARRPGPARRGPVWKRLGFYYATWWMPYRDNQDAPFGLGGRGVVAPYWSVVLLAGIVPAGRGLLIWRRRRRRPRAGYCPNCGYDLRASPGRCPECGKAAAR